MRPHKSIDSTHYGRLFPPGDRPSTIREWLPLISALADLSNEMQDDGSRPPGRDIGIQAGYTYFGQFVDHDLTNDVTSLGDVASPEQLEGTGIEPEQILNRQTPHLDLSHLYGKGPEDDSSKRFYQDGDAKLLVGERAPSTVRRKGPSNRSFDVALDDNSRPLVADRRSSENIILRQIVAAFARLHNVAVEQWRARATGLTDLFTRARLQTTWQFQWLVVNDYLPTILHPEVYDRVYVGKQPWFEWQTPQVFCIPIEWSVAAMRFGHSMVRDGYTLSDETDADLDTLLRLGLQSGPLDPKYEVDWARFFQGAGQGGLATTAQPIDTFISKGMFRIPMGTLELFNSAKLPAFAKPALLSHLQNLRLPLITLLRGAAMGLPSGQAVAEAFGVKTLNESQLTRGIKGNITPQGRILLDQGLTKSTPLWYYILRESEVKENGNHLGRTASHIIAETIFAALYDDKESYVRLGETTSMPPMWEWGNEKRQFLSLSALFEAAPDFP
jgi:heme peroxidase